MSLSSLGSITARGAGAIYQTETLGETMPEQAPDGSIIITPKEFYDGVQGDIREIKAAVSPLPALVVRVQDHDTRLSKLERIAWVALGAALASGGLDLFSLLN